MGLLFAGIGVAVTAGVIYSELKDGFDGDDVFMFVFIFVWSTLFAGGGLAFFFYGLVKARRRLQISVKPAELVVIRYGLFRSRTFQWDGDSLELTRVVDRGARAGAKAYHEIRIKPHGRSPLKIMTGHDIGDLAYVAAVINDTFGLAEQNSLQSNPS